jgi:hypothetical protein
MKTSVATKESNQISPRGLSGTDNIRLSGSKMRKLLNHYNSTDDKKDYKLSESIIHQYLSTSNYRNTSETVPEFPNSLLLVMILVSIMTIMLCPSVS